METEKEKLPFVYCDKNLKDKPKMKRYRVKLTNGKEAIATKTHRTKLLTVKEYDRKIKEIEDRIIANEIAQDLKISGLIRPTKETRCLDPAGLKEVVAAHALPAEGAREWGIVLRLPQCALQCLEFLI